MENLLPQALRRRMFCRMEHSHLGCFEQIVDVTISLWGLALAPTGVTPFGRFHFVTLVGRFVAREPGEYFRTPPKPRQPPKSAQPPTFSRAPSLRGSLPRKPRLPEVAGPSHDAGQHLVRDCGR